MIGGRGATTGTPTTAIVAVDVARKRVRAAGHLQTARSDLAAATVGSRIIVVGGKGAAGDRRDRLATRARSLGMTTRATHSIDTANVYAARRREPARSGRTQRAASSSTCRTA